MDKVVSFTDNQGEHSSGNEVPVSGQNLAYEKLDEYKTLLEIQAQLMEELFLLTEEMLKDLHYDVGKFELDTDSAEDFLDSDMLSFVSGGEEPMELAYDAEIDGVQYRTIASASCIDQEVEMNAMLCKFDNEKEEWFAYTENGWIEIPDEFIF